MGRLWDCFNSFFLLNMLLQKFIHFLAAINFRFSVVLIILYWFIRAAAEEAARREADAKKLEAARLAEIARQEELAAKAAAEKAAELERQAELARQEELAKQVLINNRRNERKYF